MPTSMKSDGGRVDLERLSLASGQAKQLDGEIKLEPISLAGQSYEVEGRQVGAKLDVSRTTTGYALRLRFDAPLSGPCVRCLENADLPLQIDAREVEQPSTDDEELRSPYVADGQLDITRWANDAVVLALPTKPVCRDDCAGLCPVCGESLNDAKAGAHDHPTGGDPRMAKLKDLKLE